MSRRVPLWVAFVLVHAAVAWLGFALAGEPMGDVYRVYEPWSAQALQGGPIVGVTVDWVYPPLALVPMVLTQGLGWLVGSYTAGWAVLVAMADAAAFALLVGDGRSRGRVTASWFWLASILALGPAGLYRLDGLTVPLVIAGSLWLVRRPWLASIVLAAATWIKVWPAAVLAAALVAVRRRGALVGGALAVSAAVLAVVAVLGGSSHAFGFVSGQATRGLQLEAPVSMLYLWGTVAGVPGSWVYYSRELLTFQVTGANVDVVIAAMTPVLVVVVAAIWALGAVQVARGVRFAALFPTLSLALVAAFIVLNKVGSPQYMCWLVPSVVVGLVVQRRRWGSPALLAVAIAALTQLVYPIRYAGVVAAEAGDVALLTLRNALLVVLLGWMVVRLVRLPARQPVRPSRVPLL
ncbi:glycosyltransferase 87 family protein [Microbacterium sp.]|uniref:glycosyltransferase 87 family protein n=1 Tax=Microbacterium sp. TaxID=51671 RepID=UPI0039E30915